MELTIQPLAETPIDTIVTCFNEAFKHYFVPFHLTTESLTQRIIVSGINLSHSYGVFENDELVAFMLIAIADWQGLKSAYNGGTGVIPKFRGQRLVKEMYTVAIPEFRKLGVEQLTLEVICENEKAIKAYKSIGMDIQRKLACYAGTVNQKQVLPEHVVVHQASSPNWGAYQYCKSFLPAWGQMDDAILRTTDAYTFLEMYEDKQLLGYAIMNPISGSIAQFAIQESHHRMHLGKALMSEVAAIKSPLKWNNIDTSYTPVHHFLRHLGLTNSINQYEMVGSIVIDED